MKNVLMLQYYNFSLVFCVYVTNSNVGCFKGKDTLSKIFDVGNKYESNGR